jgi:hypothetical protein
MLIKRIKVQAAWLLAVIMLIGPAAPSSFAAAPVDIDGALTKTLVDYYQVAQKGVLSGWEDLAAVCIAGGDLADYSLPPVNPEAHPNALLISLIKGDMTTAATYAEKLKTEDLTKPSYAYGDALELVAIEAYNRAAQASSGSFSEVPYDADTALNHILPEQNSDGGFIGYENSDTDATGMALTALALFNDGSYPNVRSAIDSALLYLHNVQRQQSDGGFSGEWAGSNSNSAAVALWGLKALGADIDNDWSVNGLTPVDALLSFQTDEGGFGFTDKSENNSFATPQAALALAQVAKDRSLAYLGSNAGEPYKSLSVSVVDAGGDYYERSVTARNSETLSDVIARAMRTPSADSDDYYCYRDGARTVGGPVYVSSLDDGADILAIHNSFDNVAYFEAEDGDTLGVNGIEISFGASATLTLMITSATAVSSPAPFAGIDVDVNGDRYPEGVTDADGKVTLGDFIDAGVHYAVALRERNDWGVITTLIGADTAILPAKITMKGGTAQTATVSVRVEGVNENILYRPALTVGNNGEKMLTVLDAVTDALDSAGISYTEIGGYISVIDGVSLGAGGEGWLYGTSDEAYLKGEKWVPGMGSLPIKDGDEIVVYYGNFSIPFPIIAAKLNEGGSVTISVKSWLTSLPVSDVSVSWAKDTAYAYTGETDEDGEILIPAAKAPVGNHWLQIDKKDASGMPGIVRLAPGYAIEVKSGSVSPSTPSAPSSPNTDELYITVTGPSGSLLARKAFSWYRGVTPLSLLRQTTLKCETDSAGAYVKSIGGFAEFDYGPNSGWLYKVNGIETIRESAAAYKLNAGDELEWFYTRDYTSESGSSAWSPAAPAPADDEEKAAASLSETAAANGAAAFDDVKAADWFYDDVEYAVKNGLFNGISADIFGPNTPMTRAMIVTVLGRLEGVSESSYTGGGFGDVAPGQYYTAYAEWAKANGIVNGVGDNMFAPDGNVSRQDFAVILARYAKLSNKDIRATRDPITFSDEADIADYAKQAVQDLYSGGIINGVGGNAFNPKAGATRAEVAAMLRRFIEN